MKSHSIISLFSAILISINIIAQETQSNDSLGLPGDNFDLYGVLELFKNAENSEDLEKKINAEDNKLNNLDLNNDGNIDYVKVMDYKKDEGRALVLQVDISETESQDIAVIEIDKTGDAIASAQIVGDEDLYGENYFVEPKEEDKVGNAPVIVNVWHWRPLRHYYGPKYVVWASPWHWAYYPVWFKPWKPVAWHIHHKRVVHYRVHCHRVHIHRAPHIKVVYHPHRKTSKVIHAPRVNHKAANKGNGSRAALVNKQPKAANKQRAGGGGKKAAGSGGGKKAGGGGRKDGR